MGTEYNITNLFAEAFGLKVTDSYRIGIQEKPQAPNGIFQGVRIIDDINEAKEISSYGTPILFPIWFEGGTYRQYNKNGEIVDKTMGRYRLPIASVISFRRDKIMSETRVNGGRGSVKEIYGFDDWQVTINGFFIPDPSQPQNLFNPLDQEKELVKWDNLACSIEANCDLLTDKEISRLTIKGIQVEPMRGRPNIRTFTVTAVSDELIELNIKTTI